MGRSGGVCTGCSSRRSAGAAARAVAARAAGRREALLVAWAVGGGGANGGVHPTREVRAVLGWAGAGWAPCDVQPTAHRVGQTPWWQNVAVVCRWLTG
jgi:hypothetical protein